MLSLVQSSFMLGLWFSWLQDEGTKSDKWQPYKKRVLICPHRKLYSAIALNSVFGVAVAVGKAGRGDMALASLLQLLYLPAIVCSPGPGDCVSTSGWDDSVGSPSSNRCDHFSVSHSLGNTDSVSLSRGYSFFPEIFFMLATQLNDYKELQYL